MAQAGVIIFILSLLDPIFLPFVQFIAGPLTLPIYIWLQLGIVLLLVAALLPASSEEEWGSIWPLAGYDNAIDAIYTRGPWWARFDELTEEGRQRQITEGISQMFGGA